MATVNIIDNSSYNIDIARITRSIRIQLRDVAHAWGEYVWHVLDHWTTTGFQVVLVDELDVAGALGYHDLGQDGNPYAFIGVKASVDNGIEVSSVVSHEIVEMVGDPLANHWVDDGQGTLWAQELCDAVESDLYGLGGVALSNFVLPSYFNPLGTAPFDRMGLVTAPFEIRPAGYAIYMTEGRVGQQFGADMPDWKKARKLARHSDERAFKRGVR